jgi:hypothetical protein
MVAADRLRRSVEALCAPECAGRAAGSPEGARAREWIAAEFAAVGLTPSLQRVPGCRGANVIAARPGRSDDARWLLVGAHYDHLGRVGDDVYWGADDNAAAVALLLELARALDASLSRGVLLVAFDGEEPPHFLTPAMGSMELAARPPVPLERIDLAITLDLVGHALGPPSAPPSVRDTLIVMGAEKSEGTRELVDGAARGDGLPVVRRLGIDLIPALSDYEPFRRARVPFLFLTCGRWPHYHQPTDTPDRLDYHKLARVARFVEGLVRAAAARSGARPAFHGDARDHASTLATLGALARELAALRPGARSLAAALDEIAGRIAPDGNLSLADWSTVLQITAVLEQGLG